MLKVSLFETTCWGSKLHCSSCPVQWLCKYLVWNHLPKRVRPLLEHVYLRLQILFAWTCYQIWQCIYNRSKIIISDQVLPWHQLSRSLWCSKKPHCTRPASDRLITEVVEIGLGLSVMSCNCWDVFRLWCCNYNWINSLWLHICGSWNYRVVFIVL